jgi:hypothetical protein
MKTPAMKPRFSLLPAALAGSLLSFTPSTWGVLITQSEAPGVLVPDGDERGVSRTLEVSAPGLTISDVNLTLTLAGDASAWNGDLYAWLRHESGGFSVLLNRPGRTATNPDGYADRGLLDVVFDDAAAGDIHSYQVSWAGSGPLTGAWQPDARQADPADVTDGSPRTAFLSAFNGGPAGGKWTLFVADLSGGGTFELESWQLNLVAVPEPAPTLFLAVVTVLGLGWRCRQRQASR